MFVERRDRAWWGRVELDGQRWRIGPCDDRDEAESATARVARVLVERGYLDAGMARRYVVEDGAEHGGDPYIYGLRRGRVDTPELDLCAGVLLGALDDLRDPAERNGARRWFRGSRAAPGFAFEEICDALGLDAGAVRSAVLNPRGAR